MKILTVQKPPGKNCTCAKALNKTLMLQTTNEAAGLKNCSIKERSETALYNLKISGKAARGGQTVWNTYKLQIHTHTSFLAVSFSHLLLSRWGISLLISLQLSHWEKSLCLRHFWTLSHIFFFSSWCTTPGLLLDFQAPLCSIPPGSAVLLIINTNFSLNYKGKKRFPRF